MICSAGVWRTFSGNEIGILLAHWMWCCWRRDHPDDDPGVVAMLASTVSSRMLQAMAQVAHSADHHLLWPVLVVLTSSSAYFTKTSTHHNVVTAY